MALNNLGFGFTISAEDNASQAFKGVENAHAKMQNGIANSARKAEAEQRRMHKQQQALYRESLKSYEEHAKSIERIAQNSQRESVKTFEQGFRTQLRQAEEQMKSQLRMQEERMKSAMRMQKAASAESSGSAHSAAAETAANTKAQARMMAGQQLQAAGAAMTHAGMSGIGMLRGFGAEAAEYEAKVTEIGTLVRDADRGKFTVAQQDKIVREMASKHGRDMIEQANALYDVVSSGGDSYETAVQRMNDANKLAVAGVMTVQEAVLGLSKIQQNYDLNAQQMTSVADALQVAMNKGQGKMTDIIPAVAHVAGTARTMNVNYDNLLEMMAIASNKMQGFGPAATGVKEMLRGISEWSSDPHSKHSKFAAQMGLNVNKNTIGGIMKDPMAFLQTIKSNAKFNQLDPAQTWGELFGSSEAQQAVAALTGSPSTNADIRKAFQDRAGAVEEGYKLMQSTAKAGYARLEQAFQQMRIDLGLAFAPTIRSIGQAIQWLMDKFNALPKSVKETIVSFMFWGSVGLILFGVLLKIAGAAMTAAGMFAEFGGVLVAAAPYLAAVAAVVGLIVLAFEGFKVAFDKNVGGFGGWIRSLYEKVKLGWTALVEIFTTGGFSDAVLKELDKAGNEGVYGFVVTVWGLWRRLLHFFDELSNGFSEVIGAMKGPIQSFWESFNLLLESLGFGRVQFDLAKSSWEGFGAVGRVVGNMLARVFEVIITYLSMMMNFWAGLVAVVRANTGVWEKLGGAFVYLFKSLGLWVGEVSTSVSQLGSTKSAFAEWGMVIGNVIIAMINGIANLISWFTAMFNVCVPLASATVTVVVAAFRIIAGVFEFFGGLITLNWSMMWHGIKQIASGAVEAVLGIMFYLVQQVASIMDVIAKLMGRSTNYYATSLQWKREAIEATQRGLGVDKAAKVELPKPGDTTWGAVVGSPLGYVDKNGPSTLYHGSGTKVPGASIYGVGTSGAGLSLGDDFGRSLAAKTGGTSMPTGQATVAQIQSMMPAPLATPVEGPRETTINLRTAVELNGDILAEAINKAKIDSSNRSYGDRIIMP